MGLEGGSNTSTYKKATMPSMATEGNESTYETHWTASGSRDARKEETRNYSQEETAGITEWAGDPDGDMAY